jgi:chromosome partitioning protein
MQQSQLFIDTDPQGSAYKWFERREAETPSVIREPDPDALLMQQSQLFLPYQ